MNDEKKAIEVLKYCKGRSFSAFDKIYFDDGTNMCVFQAIEILLKTIEKSYIKGDEKQMNILKFFSKKEREYRKANRKAKKIIKKYSKGESEYGKK